MSHTTNTVKRQKLMSSEDEKREELTVAGPSREVTPPKIFKLTIDCFDEIFEYLSLGDLIKFGFTCKTMQQIAGKYFKRNYSAAENICEKDGIIKEGNYLECFNEFISSIIIDERPRFDYLQSHTHQLKSINQLCLENLS